MYKESNESCKLPPALTNSQCYLHISFQTPLCARRSVAASRPSLAHGGEPLWSPGLILMPECLTMLRGQKGLPQGPVPRGHEPPFCMSLSPLRRPSDHQLLAQNGGDLGPGSPSPVTHLHYLLSTVCSSGTEICQVRTWLPF